MKPINNHTAPELFRELADLPAEPGTVAALVLFLPGGAVQFAVKSTGLDGQPGNAFGFQTDATDGPPDLQTALAGAALAELFGGQLPAPRPRQTKAGGQGYTFTANITHGLN